MFSLNVVVFGGTIVADPKEIRTVGASGSKTTEFRIAVNDPAEKVTNFADRKKTLFVDVQCWNRSAELAVQYLKKGRNVIVEGRLEEDKWTGQDGAAHSKIRVQANRFTFVPDGKGPSPEGGDSGGEQGEDAPPSTDAAPAPARSAAPAASRGAAAAPSSSASNPSLVDKKLKNYNLDNTDSDVPF